jgi:hypothetical protein
VFSIGAQQALKVLRVSHLNICRKKKFQVWSNCRRQRRCRCLIMTLTIINQIWRRLRAVDASDFSRDFSAISVKAKRIETLECYKPSISNIRYSCNPPFYQVKLVGAQHHWFTSNSQQVSGTEQASAVFYIFMQLGFSTSNWQKVRLNTDLLKQRRVYLYTNANGKLKLNEIKAIKVWLKIGIKWRRRFWFCGEF